MGKRAMGALEFEPSTHIMEVDTSSRLHIDELTKLADSIFKDRANFQEKLLREDKSVLDILKIGTSAGGAKPKAIIAYNDLTNEVRSGQVTAPDGFTYWLLKFDGTSYSEHDKVTNNPKGIGNIEYAYFRMAKDCGIDMMESRLLKEGGSHHYSPSGTWTNKHQMSINGKQDGFTFYDLETVGRRMDINNPNEIIEKITEVVSNWNIYARECGVKKTHIQQIAANLLLLKK